jgi:hypothetical protein
MLKRIRNIYAALHEVIDITGSALSKFGNDDPAPNQASLYPLCNTHHHISTVTRLHDALPSTEVTAKPTDDTAHSPATGISPVLLQAPESTLLASTPATTVSQSPQTTAVPLSSPLVQHLISLTPAPAAHKLPSLSHPAPTPSGMHYTSQHTSSDSTVAPSGSVQFESVSVYPTPTSSIPAPQTASIPAPIMTVRSTDLPARAEATSGLDQPKPDESHIQ